MKRLGLHTYLFLCLGTVAALPSLLLGVQQARRWETVQAEQADREGLFAARALARDVEHLIETHVRAVEALAGQVEARGRLDAATLQPMVTAQRARFGGFSFMYVAGAAGRSIVADPPFGPDHTPNAGIDYSDRDYYREMKRSGRTAVSRVQLGRRSGVPNVQIAAPIRRRGDLVGLAEGSVDLTGVQERADRIAANVPGARVIVVDAYGRVLAHPDETARKTMRDLSGMPLFRSTERPDGEIRTGTTEDGVPVRVAAATVKGWTVLVCQPLAGIQAQATAARYQTLVTVATALLAGLLLAGALAMVLSRPIVNLAAIASAVGDGDFSRSLPVLGPWHPREVNALTAAVGTMVAQLRARTEDLEQRVADRTTQLSRSNDELEASLHRLRETQNQLLQSVKMAAVGRLAGGVAHDFNNFLTIIAGCGDLLLHSLDPAHPARAEAEEIRKATARAADLIGQLLAFSRQQMLRPVVLDINAVVADLSTMLRRLIGADVDLRFLPGDGLGRVRADRGQIEQVLMNLAVNARDAMPNGGALIVESADFELDEARAARHVTIRPGRYVLLTVTDTGAGMDEETRSHLFEPFFTTKEPGKGTGLGLATVYGIVEQSGGTIQVYSEPGRGTTFKIYLPRADGPVEAAVTPPPKVADRPGTETILLVEDEDAVRSLARRILRGKGYSILEARNGTDALDVSRRHDRPIALLLTDVNMPMMNGRELATHLAGSRPDMKVLFMSGYTNAVLFPQEAFEAGVAFLAKPFTIDALVGKVREVLDTPPSRAPSPRA